MVNTFGVVSMAHLVRQSKTYFVDASGARVPKGTPGAKKVREKSAKWYGAGIPGQGKKRFPLASDKRVAEKMLADLVTKAERGQALMPEKGEASRSLDPLVVEFEATIGRKATEKHTRTVGGHVRRVLTGCKIATLADLNANDLEARVEVFVWSLVGAEDGVVPGRCRGWGGGGDRSIHREARPEFHPLALAEAAVTRL